MHAGLMIAALLSYAVVSACAGDPDAEAPAPERVSIDSLANLFARDPATAEERYGGRRLAFQGFIDDVVSNADGAPYLVVRRFSALSVSARCFVAPEALPRYEQFRRVAIVVTGTCNGFNRDADAIFFVDCTVEPDPDSNTQGESDG